ncbi:MAG: amidohydrolase family protein [Actinomycetota bacterium]
MTETTVDVAASSYTGDRAIHDADSHLMEPNDWLAHYADSATAAKLRDLELSGGGGKATHELVDDCWARRDDPERTAELAADVVNGPKGYYAYGAMDREERVAALDQLGYRSQLVFSTFAPSQFADDADLDLVYGGASAHNRGMIDFTATDARLVPVGYVPLQDPQRAAACVREAIDAGIGAMWVPHGVPQRISPTHPDYNPMWAALAEAGVPMVLHLGANGTNQMAPTWHNNGRDPGHDFIGGGENLRSKDFLNLHHDAENLLACLVLDGVFEQFEGLRCGVIEIGAGWVPNLLASLDASIRAFGRHEPELAKLSLSPSDYVRRQISFTPWHFEDVGWLIANTAPELYLYSSDWPHPEGGRNPLAAFDASLDAAGIGPVDQRMFFHDNMARLLGDRVRS